MIVIGINGVMRFLFQTQAQKCEHQLLIISKNRLRFFNLSLPECSIFYILYFSLNDYIQALTSSKTGDISSDGPHKNCRSIPQVSLSPANLLNKTAGIAYTGAWQ